MRFYCSKCGTVQYWQEIEGGMQCQKCNKYQRVNSFKNKSMARKSSSSSSSTTYTPPEPLAKASSSDSGGIALPQFDVNAFMPSDLFSVSSSLPQMEKAQADQAESAIEKQRNAVRVAKANITLARDVVKTGTEYVRLVGDTIDYRIAIQDNVTKEVKFQTAEVNTDIAINKLSEAQERLIQSGIALDGVRGLTPLIQEEWEAKRDLQVSKVETIKLAAQQANSKLEAQMRELEGAFG